MDSPNAPDGCGGGSPRQPPEVQASKDIDNTLDSPNRRTFLLGSAAAVGAVVRGFEKKAALTGAAPVIETASTIDTGVVHLAGAETITGVKTFTVPPIVPSVTFVPLTPTNSSGSAIIQKVKSISTQPDWNWFIDVSSSFTGQSQTFVDPLVSFGWNSNAAAGREDATKPALAMVFEGDFWTNVGVDATWHHQFECYFQYVSAAGVITRPMGFDVDWTTNKCEFTIECDEFSMFNSEGSITVVSWMMSTKTWSFTGGTSVNIYNSSATPDVGLSIDCSANASGNAHFYTYVGIDRVYRHHMLGNGTEQWQFVFNQATGILQWYDVVNQRDWGRFVPGPTALVSRFDVQATIRFADVALSATTATAGANGDVPVQVVGYFIVQDSTGTGRKIPYYAV